MTFEITFVKFIETSDIEFFCLFTSYIQIDGEKIPFVKSSHNLDEKYFPTFHLYKDMFYIREKDLDESKILFLRGRNYGTVIDIPENEMERQKYPVFPISFLDIEGFWIEKQSCDINEFLEPPNPKLVGEKQSFFLDRFNPDKKVWNMVKEYMLIDFFDF